MDHPAANEPADLVRGKLLAGEDGKHAGRRHCLSRVDLQNRGVSMGRTHEHGIGLAWTMNIVRVLTSTGDKTKIFAAAHGLADSGIHRISPSRLAVRQPGPLDARPWRARQPQRP